MALAAVKTFVAAEVLYASDLNASITNVLNNPMSLISPWTANLDADGYDLVDLGELEFRDESADPTADGRLRRSGDELTWRTQDARTTTTARPWAIWADTTGTPAAGIGIGMLFQAESADENPSDFGALDFVATDIGAGTEDTVLDVMLRVAGAALSAAYRFVTTTAFRAIFTHANSADRTYTLPNVGGGVVISGTTGEWLQRATGAQTPTMGADETLGNQNGSGVTFAVAFSGTPVLLVSGLSTSNARAVMFSGISSTAFTPFFLGAAGAAIDVTLHYVALGPV